MIAIASILGIFTLASYHRAPGQSAEAAVARVKRAIGAATTVHLKIFHDDLLHSRGLDLSYELWYSNGRWRESSRPDQGGERIKIKTSNGIEYYGFDPRTGKPVHAAEIAPQPTDFTIKAVGTSWSMPTSTENLTDVGPVVLDGKQTELMEYGEGKPARTRLWVLIGTDLPLRIERQIWLGDKWKATDLLTFQFTEPISDSVFDPATLRAPHSNSLSSSEKP